ncbi:MAG: HD family phosphohydrolase [Elainellaceae cyanobacterium]
MKSFRLLTQQFDQWWRVQVRSTSQKPSNHTLRQAVVQAKRCTKAARSSQPWQQISRLKHLKPDQVAEMLRPAEPLRKRNRAAKRSRPKFIFVVAVVSLTSTIGYRFYNEPKLDTGAIAPQTLRAPASAAVEDAKTTEQKRNNAVTGAVPVLMIDSTTNQRIYQALQRVLDQGDELREQAGAFPFVETSILSTNTQNYLRQAEEWEWRATIAAAEGNGRAISQSSASTPSTSGNSAQEENSPRSSQQLAIIELQSYYRTASRDDFTALKQLIERARQRYATAIAALSKPDSSQTAYGYDEVLFQLTDEQWTVTKVGIREALERILVQGIPPGLPDNVLANAVQVQTEIDVPPAGSPLAVDILTPVVKPNLIEDPERTRRLAEQAAQAIDPEIVEIRRGEVIVQAGETISQQQFVLLDHFGMSRRGVNWLGLGGFAGLIAGAVGVFLLVEHRFHGGLRRRDHILILLLTLSTPLVLALRLPSVNLPMVGLLVGSFYGSPLGVAVVGLLSVILPIGTKIGGSHLIASASGSLLGTLLAGRLRSREELAMLGGAVGLTTGIVYLLVSLIVSSAASSVWYSVLMAAAIQSLMGVAWSIVALGVSPYLEHLFDLVTPIRLVELSNPNRPLLKRVASEAPGTFQHTLFVASLAEAAARELGCNVELVRAGTLYHDIGKMHDPLGFIENQMGGPNKHDLIDDPWKSAAIIKKHVTEGLVMARKCRLPTAIQAFIPEHQGTMLITYFYYQAQQRAKADPLITINEADFRYDGPIPQSRETGIVMLADSCEAALRSLKDATPEEALAMVNRIMRARWQDNQLIDSGLTREDMSRIANIFVHVWKQFNHKRIPYPKGAMAMPKPSTVAPKVAP